MLLNPHLYWNLIMKINESPQLIKQISFKRVIFHTIFRINLSLQQINNKDLFVIQEYKEQPLSGNEQGGPDRGHLDGVLICQGFPSGLLRQIRSKPLEWLLWKSWNFHRKHITVKKFWNVLTFHHRSYRYMHIMM